MERKLLACALANSECGTNKLRAVPVSFARFFMPGRQRGAASFICTHQRRWAFSAIDGIFAAITDAAQLNLNPLGFNIFGHSAGAQFVHRYVAFINSSQSSLASHSAADACAVRPSPMLQAFAANAGSYMLPVFEQDFPFGVGGLETHFSRQTLAAFVGAPLTILLGADDTGTGFCEVGCQI